MILVDIGNTNLHFAELKGSGVREILKIPASQAGPDFLRKKLAAFRRREFLVCSVVPKLTRSFLKLFKNVCLVEKDIKVPLKTLYRRNQVGADRLVAAFASNRLFPGARFILDFGTATTLDFLSGYGDYQGGIILPGIGSTLEVFSRCALLPDKVILRKSRSVIPRNTAASISRGVEEGFSAMINSLIQRYKHRLRLPRPKVVITGGSALLILPQLDFSYRYEPLLVLKGLGILAKKR